METSLTTFTHRFVFLALLAASILLLPACGGSGNVKSQKASETVLNPESTPAPTSSGTADIGMPGEQDHGTPINTYVEKIKRSKGAKGTKITLTPSTAAAATTPETAPQTTPAQTPAMETTVTPVKTGGSHWILWTILVVAAAGIGWFFWSKNQSGDSGQPNPPVGGLSPVSGFTGVKNDIEDDSNSEPSFWSKKLF